MTHANRIERRQRIRDEVVANAIRRGVAPAEAEQTMDTVESLLKRWANRLPARAATPARSQVV